MGMQLDHAQVAEKDVFLGSAGMGLVTVADDVEQLQGLLWREHYLRELEVCHDGHAASHALSLRRAAARLWVTQTDNTFLFTGACFGGVEGCMHEVFRSQEPCRGR